MRRDLLLLAEMIESGRAGRSARGLRHGPGAASRPAAHLSLPFNLRVPACQICDLVLACRHDRAAASALPSAWHLITRTGYPRWSCWHGESKTTRGGRMIPTGRSLKLRSWPVTPMLSRRWACAPGQVRQPTRQRKLRSAPPHEHSSGKAIPSSRTRPPLQAGGTSRPGRGSAR